MNVVQVAGECSPFVQTGDLAEAVGALAQALVGLGHEVSVFLPGYRAALEHPAAASAVRVLRLPIELRDQYVPAEIQRLRVRPGLTVYFVCRDEFFDRRFCYGNGERDYDDNAERFVFFGKAVAEAMRLLELKADVVHGHDWQAALLPLFVRFLERQHGITLAIKTVFTLHDIAYQGVFPANAFSLTNLPDELLSIDGLEFYGQVNFLKGGLLFADRITTVSRRYAWEILTPEFGCGLEGVVATRADELVGILHGIDTAAWDPAKDAALPARFDAADPGGRAACRTALLEKTGLDARGKPAVFAVATPLTKNKGAELLLAAAPFFAQSGARLVVVADGDKPSCDGIAALAGAHPRRIAFWRGADEAKVRLALAGADFLLLPALVEPGGTMQLRGLRYGAIPVATHLGGHVDTIADLGEDPLGGTGILFAPTPKGIRDGLDRALALHADKTACAAARRRGMERDSGWSRTAEAYDALYQDAI